MRRLRDFLLGVLEACLRVLPWPTEPRLIRVGNPGRKAPVLATCNYELTVRRVLRALRGEDAYLLVASTRGINVWCSAAGGYFTAHQVISILRTSGIGELVDHRRLVLPQLSATGVERKLVEQRTGWHVVFGPVYARDLPAYLASGRKTEAMRQVRFPLLDRLEMALAWAFPITVVGGTVLAIGWRHLVLPFLAMAWTLTLGVYALFPWFAGRVEPTKQLQPGWTRYLVFFDPRIRRSLMVWVLFVVGLWGYAFVHGTWDLKGLVGWSLASLFLALLTSMDLAGSTPLYKSGLHEDRLLRVELDKEACRGRAMCWEVCPKNCYVIDTTCQKAIIAEPDACVQCGACIVQCPENALTFFTPSGQQIPPAVIRTYKLNLLGQRATSISDSQQG
ncbi:MAG: HgcAB-like fusion protein [Terriglobia bacterium]